MVKLNIKDGLVAFFGCFSATLEFPECQFFYILWSGPLMICFLCFSIPFFIIKTDCSENYSYVLSSFMKSLLSFHLHVET